MIRISDWYTLIGEFSFPTVFINLDDSEQTVLIKGAEAAEPGVKNIIAKLQAALSSLPRPGFVGTDVCAPTDSPYFRPGRWITFGKAAWNTLSTSEKVKTAFRQKQTEKLIVRPFRHMDRTREFRMFVQGGRLVGMSQYRLEGHFAKIAARREEIWLRGNTLFEKISARLPWKEVVIDCYLCSNAQMLLVDLNPWGGSTDPLLFKTWERDWTEVPELKLIPSPVKMSGDVSVSF